MHGWMNRYRYSSRVWFPVIYMWRVCSLHQKALCATVYSWLQFLLEGNWWMPQRGPKIGAGEVGSVSAAWRVWVLGALSIRHVGHGVSSRVLAQLHLSPHWVTVSKLHQCFELQDPIYKSRITGRCGLKGNHARKLPSTVPGTKELKAEPWPHSSYHSRGKKNTHQKFKSPNQRTRHPE